MWIFGHSNRDSSNTIVLKRCLQTRHVSFIYMQHTCCTCVQLLYDKTSLVTQCNGISTKSFETWPPRIEEKQVQQWMKKQKTIAVVQEDARVGSRTHFDHLISSRSRAVLNKHGNCAARKVREFALKFRKKSMNNILLVGTTL